MLSCTNKFIKKYLYTEPAGKHWLTTGQQICGTEYWPELFPYQLSNFFCNGSEKQLDEDENDARYVTMLMLCPWRSKATISSVEPLRGIEALAGKCKIRWMNINYENYQWVISADVTFPDRAVITRYRLTSEAFDTDNEGPHSWRGTRQTNTEAPEENSPPAQSSPEEAQFMLEIKAQDWRPAAMYPDSEIQRVFFVHNGLFAVLCYNSSFTGSKTQAYFVSRKTQQVIYTLKGRFTKNIVIKPAAIWILEADYRTIRIAPRQDRAVKKEIMLKESGASENVRWAAYRGDMSYVFSVLEAKNVDLHHSYLLPYESLAYPFKKIERFIIAGGSTVALTVLLNHDQSFANYDTLHYAVAAGKVDMIRVLLEYKFDHAKHRSSILHEAIASQHGTREMVKLLLDSGAKVEEADQPWDEGEKKYRLHRSVKKQTPKEVYEFFLECGMKIDS